MAADYVRRVREVILDPAQTARLSFQFLEPSMTQERDSEVGGSSAFGLGAFVHTLRAVQGADVAEAAFVFARYTGSWLVRGNPADQGAEVLFELGVQAAPGNSYRLRRIDHFSGQLGVLVLRQCSGQGVYVDHDQHVVGGLLLASFDVDDQGVVFWTTIRSGLPASVADCPRRRKLF